MDYEMPASAQQILAYIKRISTNNEATASYNDIRRECGISRASAINGIAILRACGAIERTYATTKNGGYGSNTYTIKGEQS
jgi:predicted transcriptional regulator